MNNFAVRRNMSRAQEAFSTLSTLFSDAKSGKYPGEHVLGGSFAGDLAEIAKRIVKSDQCDFFA